NAHDANAVAEGFATDAEYVNEDGLPLRGREAIRKHFAATFEQLPKARIAIEIDAVQEIAPNAAVEDGRVEFRRDDKSPPSTGRTVAVHVQQEGRWVVSRVRDFPPADEPAPARDSLRPLEWLVGDWVQETEGAYIRTSCRPVDNGNYLLQQFKIRMT